MHTHYIIRLAALLSMLSLASCSGGSGSDGDSTDQAGDSFFSGRSDLALATLTTTADTNGESQVTIDLPSGATKFNVTANSNTYISIDRIVGTDGTVHLDYQGEIKTLSTFFIPFVASASTPSRDFDVQINGGSYLVGTTAAASVNPDQSYTAAVGEPVTFTTVSSRDSDLTSGVLPVNIIYVGGVGADSAYRTAVQSATTRMAQIYAQVGIQLQVTEVDLDGPTVLPYPGTGDVLFLTLSSSVSFPALNVCVGYDIQDSQLLGQSGGIPGAPIPTVRSCVAVSMLLHAGVSGTFDASNLELLGETLAHEGGHYLGLFHVVESDLTSLDPLSDTPACSGGSCDSVLGTNLMYPYPVNSGGGYVVQDALTPQQGGVLNRYVAVS